MHVNTPRIVGLPFPVSISEEIRSRRYLYTRMSLESFAKSIGVTRDWYRKLEEGKESWRPDENKLRAVEAALGWPPNYILHRCGQFHSEEVVMLSELVAHYGDDFIGWVRELHGRAIAGKGVKRA